MKRKNGPALGPFFVNGKEGQGWWRQKQVGLFKRFPDFIIACQTVWR